MSDERLREPLRRLDPIGPAEPMPRGQSSDQPQPTRGTWTRRAPALDELDAEEDGAR